VLSRLAVVVRVDPEMIRVETLNGKSTSGMREGDQEEPCHRVLPA
jgi:hypothetical protein